MRIDYYDIDKILHTPQITSSYDEEEEGGFFKKLFSKKTKENDSIYDNLIEEYGRENLRADMEEQTDAFLIRFAPIDTVVILTNNFFILPEQAIVPLERVRKFCIGNVINAPFTQYAIDRINEPYDPDYVSEYEGEEGFELERFNIRLLLIDELDVRYEYVFPLELADREAFRDLLNERCVDVEDLSDEFAMRGEFNEEDEWDVGSL